MNQVEQVKLARDATAKLASLFDGAAKPTFGHVLTCIHETGLLEVPDALRPIALRVAAEKAGTVGTEPGALDEDYGDPVLDAWDAFLLAPFQQIEPYVEYVEGRAPFDTHQGIKGREFPRVLVIIDDQDARGFSFSYEKLFGAKAKSATDLDNESQGKDTTIDRTRRLFYVTCSRAMSSLGIVAYTGDPAAVQHHVVSQGWFTKDEAEIVG